MFKVVGCFVDAHDHRLVALAALVCALASFTTVQLLRHARGSTGSLRTTWLGVAAAAGGSGIWATHFISMLAYTPGVPSGYDVGLTVLSLVYAIALTGFGLAIALSTTLPLAAWLGGAVVGGGIAAMHYTGMEAFEVAGKIVWDPRIVAASIVLGTALASVSLPIALGPSGSIRQKLAAAVILLLAICALHFTAMGAVTIVPDPRIEIAASALPPGWLAVAVALASFAILLSAGAALELDLRDRRRAEIENARLHSLANAAVEGLVVCRDGAIVSANESFARLAGVPTDALNNVALSSFFPDESALFVDDGHPDRSVETDLRRSDGVSIPVELILRPVEYGSRPHYAVAIRDLRARRKAEQQIQFLALHDGLTGLANRASFNGRLDLEIQVATAKGGKLAVLCLDLDRFKEVNDLFGHAAGDKLLQDVARIVTGVLAEKQLMSRLGGDEFAVLAPIDNADAAGRVAERILEALRTESAAASGPMIATSIGIAIYPDDATDRTLLLNYADTALYRAKSEGRGAYRFYEERMGAEVRERRLLELELRHAIARGQIEVAYQPQTRIGTGEVVGFEALLRWRHPVRGPIPPSTFIPIAEESGLILQLGEWVMRESCREAASWSKPLSIAVNVSPIQVHSSYFVRMLHEALFHTGLSPHRLEIEITETALMRDPARALSTLRQVKALGVSIAMDDFGTGFSSLSNLRQFPFDKIKIDGSFIKAVDSDERTAAIVRSVLGLGRGLGLPVIAEGVETPRELDFLKTEGCNGAQGYFIGRPAPIAAFREHTGATVEPRRASAAA
jgi:diguanylate cyclase (GGDEF)-like protein/PAS domain S-box-containing protein